MRIILPAAAALTITAFAIISFARGAEAADGGIVVTEAWARATPPGASVGAAYVAIENRSTADDSLVGAASPTAQRVMLHETVEEDGVARMQPLDNVIAPAGGTVEMRPGGIHMMLMGLSAPLEEGASVSLTLTFEKAGEVAVEAAIAPIGAEGPMELDHHNN